MAKKGQRKPPDPPEREDMQTAEQTEVKRKAPVVRIKNDLYYKLSVITTSDDITAADFLDPLIRGPIEAAFKRVAEKNKRIAEGDQED